MKRSRLMRVGEEFDRAVRQLQEDIKAKQGLDVGMTDLTNKIARDLKKRSQDEEKDTGVW